jgi:hypothetical protein
VKVFGCSDDCARRLTVCQLTRESRGNGGGLRPRVWLRLKAPAGGNWTPVGEGQSLEPEIAMDAHSSRDDQSYGDNTEIYGLLSNRRMLQHFSHLENCFEIILANPTRTKARRLSRIDHLT